MRQSAAATDPAYQPLIAGGREATLAKDIADINRDRFLDPATRQRLVDARCGQGKFRAALDARFGGRCAVTGIGLREVLRASHIHAWSACDTHEEKLDPNNGLLLAANLDALFDRYLISFAPDGEVLLSSRVADADRLLLGPVHRLRAKPTAAQVSYLVRHNEEFRRRNSTRP